MDVEQRIGKAWKAFFAQRDQLLNKHVDAGIRIKALNVLVAPVLLYGAGGWTIAQADLDKILQTHKRMCIKILGMRVKPGQSWLDFLSRRSSRKIKKRC